MQQRRGRDNFQGQFDAKTKLLGVLSRSLYSLQHVSRIATVLPSSNAPISAGWKAELFKFNIISTFDSYHCEFLLMSTPPMGRQFQQRRPKFKRKVYQICQSLTKGLENLSTLDVSDSPLRFNDHDAIGDVISTIKRIADSWAMSMRKVFVAKGELQPKGCLAFHLSGCLLLDIGAEKGSEVWASMACHFCKARQYFSHILMGSLSWCARVLQHHKFPRRLIELLGFPGGATDYRPGLGVFPVRCHNVLCRCSHFAPQ